MDAYTKDRNLGDVDDVTNVRVNMMHFSVVEKTKSQLQNYHDAQAQLTPLEVTVSVLSAEVEVISTSLKGESSSHNKVCILVIKDSDR